MKICFIHDAIFIRKDDSYYTTGTLTNEYFSQYLQFCDTITVIARFRDYTDKDRKYIKEKNKITIDKIQFKCVKKFSRSQKNIKEEIKKSDFLILRIHSFLSVIAYYYAKKYDKKYMCECVSCAFDCLWNYNIIGKIVSIPMFYITRKIAQNAYAVTYVSNSFLQKRYKTRGKELACSDVLIENILDSKIVDKKVDLKENSKYIKIGNIANLDVRYKGQEYLIKALAQLKKEKYNVQLCLVGGGKGEHLKALCKKLGVLENVKFIGPIPHDKIFSFLNDIDIYIQPSNAESHGRVIIEAMSQGCPIIGSNVGGIPELVEKKYVFKKKKYKDLVKKIKLLLESKENLKKSSIYSLAKAKEFKKNKLYEKKYCFLKKIMEEIYD